MNRVHRGDHTPLALVVDDDSTMQLMLQMTLAKAGLRTVEAADAR